jgi:hypothetical protein
LAYPADQGKAEARYHALEGDRNAFLSRAVKCALLTIPSLIVENPDSNSASFPTPYQSIAAQGVNNLASKLMLSLLPPNAPFFRLKVDTSKLSEEERTDEAMLLEIDKGLSKIERAVVEEIASASDRVVLFEALKHLLVGGNALLYVDPEGGMKCYHLNSYVVRRDGRGDVQEIAVREKVFEDNLPEETRKQLHSSTTDADSDVMKKEPLLYTHVQRKGGKWEIYQEVSGITVDGSTGTYPLDACPWIAMRLLRVDGEHYGRSYVEEYYGDIASLDGLCEAIVMGAAAAAKVINLVHPNSTTRAADLAKCPNMGFVSGSAAAVDVLQLDKFADFRTARETIVGIEQRLERAFILNSAIQRNAERVTREEILKMVEDLEAALGGVYSLLAVEFQAPYIACKLKQLTQQNKLPYMPKGLVRPLIVTGVEAIGRGTDKERLLEMLSALRDTVGPEQMASVIKMDVMAMRLCSAMGIDPDGLLVTPEEQARTMQTAQANQSMQTLGPDVIRAAGQIMKDPEALSNAQNMMGGMELDPAAMQQMMMTGMGGGEAP